MPIFLKPSHEIRILNVNIVYLCVCVRTLVCNLIYLRFWIFSEEFGSKTSWAWMSRGSEMVATLQTPRPTHWDVTHFVTSNTCSSSVYSSSVFCEAQMESNRRFCLFSQFWSMCCNSHERCYLTTDLDWHSNRQSDYFLKHIVPWELNHSEIQFPLVV